MALPEGSRFFSLATGVNKVVMVEDALKRSASRAMAAGTLSSRCSCHRNCVSLFAEWLQRFGQRLPYKYLDESLIIIGRVTLWAPD